MRAVLTHIIVIYTLLLMSGWILIDRRRDIAKANAEITALSERVSVLERQVEALLSVEVSGCIDTDWFLFKLSLAFVESSYNADAVHPRSLAGGLFQILPAGDGGFLCEANRLTNGMFTDECRFDVGRSNAMFEVVNRRHNPNKCIETAIRLHNPRAGANYRAAILRSSASCCWRFHAIRS